MNEWTTSAWKKKQWYKNQHSEMFARKRLIKLSVYYIYVLDNSTGIKNKAEKNSCVYDCIRCHCQQPTVLCNLPLPRHPVWFSLSSQSSKAQDNTKRGKVHGPLCIGPIITGTKARRASASKKIHSRILWISARAHPQEKNGHLNL